MAFSLLLLMVGQVAIFQADRLPAPPAPEEQALVNQARTLPAEFRADTLLRIADSVMVTEESKKKELIEDAFWSGSHAYLPYMQKTDGRLGQVAINSARANRLEALTLQSRAVRAMLPVDSGNALQLFEQISQPALPRLTCSSPSTPDVVDYYETAVLVFATSFTPKQREQEQDIALLRQLIISIDAPAQVSPALEMVFAVNITPDQRTDLLSSLGSRLEQISRSDREFGAAETELGSTLSQLKIERHDAEALVAALRSYIVRHVGGHRCTDNIPSAGKLASSAEQFNALVDKIDPGRTRYKRISLDEAKPTGDDGTYPNAPTAPSPQPEEIEDALKWLTHGYRERNGQPLRWTPQERSSRNWLQHFDDTSKLVHDLKENDEPSPEAFFCEKADALNLLATLVPPGPTRDKAMDEYREFVESYYPSIGNPNLWFTMFRHMLYTARFSDDPKNKAWILNELAKSVNPVISVYAQLEERVGAPAETYPPLHVQAAQK